MLTKLAVAQLLNKSPTFYATGLLFTSLTRDVSTLTCSDDILHCTGGSRAKELGRMWKQAVVTQFAVHFPGRTEDVHANFQEIWLRTALFRWLFIHAVKSSK